MSITYRLRSTAERYELAAPKAATLMMEGADVIESLDIENVKLRELVRHMHTCMEHPSCTTCEYDGDACDFEYDMRKLRIEFK